MAEVGADIGRVRIRLPATISKGEVIRVRALVTHPMEILSFDKDQKPVPKNYQFVYQIVVTYNGKEILQAETTQAVSQSVHLNPVKLVNRMRPPYRAAIEAQRATFAGVGR